MKYCLSNLAFECEFPVVLENIEDEIKREAAFARQALVAAAFARRIVMAAKIPFSRPDGYFCEMLKTEEHMKKISERITEEKEATKAAEQARKQRMNRKFGKRIQVEREQEKQQKVTKDKKSLNLLRKRKRDERDDEFKIDLEEDTGYETEGKRRNHGGGRRKEERTISKKRQAKNEKYGWGGKKHGKKRNNKESADQDEFNVSRNRRPFNNNSIKKSHKKQRPGKTRRQAIRHRKASRK